MRKQYQLGQVSQEKTLDLYLKNQEQIQQHELTDSLRDQEITVMKEEVLDLRKNIKALEEKGRVLEEKQLLPPSTADLTRDWKNTIQEQPKEGADCLKQEKKSLM